MSIIETFSPRVQCAILTGIAGGAVAQTMSIWGGELARHLPPMLTMIVTATFGAAVSGAVFANVFGRSGWGGALVAAVLWPFVTLFGAAFAASAVALFFETGWRRSLVHSLVDAAAEGAFLGALAVTDGVLTSPVVAGVWGVALIAVHSGMKQEKAATT